MKTVDAYAGPPRARPIRSFSIEDLGAAAYQLRSAVVILDAKGWCQGISYDGDGRCCMVGAIYWQSMEHREDTLNAHKLLNSHLAVVVEPKNPVLHSAANWNDVRGRTKDEVCYELLAAAKWIEDYIRAAASDA